jgi:MerR family transcriptional regulator/heat shock protein HspR
LSIVQAPHNLYRAVHISYSTEILDAQPPEVVGVPDPRRGVYAISVAAELVGTGIQNLRVYERRGLLTPDRTSGGSRLYSDDDVVRLERIRDLLAEGLNLVGIARVLELEDEVDRLRAQLGECQDEQSA